MTGKGFSWAKHNYWGNIKRPYNEHNPEWTLEAALEFIEANKNKPFYLHYTTTLMHGGGKAWSDSMKHPLVSGGKPFISELLLTILIVTER